MDVSKSYYHNIIFSFQFSKTLSFILQKQYIRVVIQQAITHSFLENLVFLYRLLQ